MSRFHTQDGNVRQQSIVGDKPDTWDFSAHPAADIVVINLGTNDNNTHNNVTSETYVKSYIELIEGVHKVWPKADVICMVCPSLTRIYFPSFFTFS
jgi:hypothetical protein